MHPLANLAKSTVESYIQNNGEIISPPLDFPNEFMQKKAGVFVSIRSNNKLRGCIGTYLPAKENIARETIANAILAATSDNRFQKIQSSDLASLKYEVYVLGLPEPVNSTDSLNPAKYGIIVYSASSNRGALLLPGLDGIDTVEAQLSATCKKAGIDRQNEKISLQRFEAQKFI